MKTFLQCMKNRRKAGHRPNTPRYAARKPETALGAKIPYSTTAKAGQGRIFRIRRKASPDSLYRITRQIASVPFPQALQKAAQSIKNAQTTPKENTMANKKIERAKELQRRRKRREERLKQRIREAKAAAKS